MELTAYQIMVLVGVPSLISGLFAFVKVKFKRAKNDMDAMKLGIQALLRSQMINDYNKYMALGYCPIYARDSFENVWQQYHNLGLNGVMDDIHNKLLQLPTALPEKGDANAEA